MCMCVCRSAYGSMCIFMFVYLGRWCVLLPFQFYAPQPPPTSWKSLDVTYFEGIQSYIPCSCNSHICFCVTLHIVFYVVVSIGRKLDRYCHQSYAYILVNFKALPADLVYIVMFYLHIIFCNVTLIMTFPQQHICFNLTHYPFKTLFFIISVIQFFNCQELI